MTHGKSNRFLLLYASQTGQAKAIAEEVAEKAVKHGLRPDLNCVSNTEKKFWLERESCTVLVSSTTGEGDPPDTALKFWKRLKKKTLPDDHLGHLNYILLGLGDSNYTNFCNFPKNVDQRLTELGAKKIIPSTFADDAVGLEVAVEPWMDDQIFPALRKHLGLSNDQTSDGNSLADSDPEASSVVDPDHMQDTLNNRSVTQDVHENGSSMPDGDNTVTNAESMDNQPVIESSGNDTQTILDDAEESDAKSKVIIEANQTEPCTSELQLENEDVEENLVRSLPPLSECSLNIPACPPRFLSLKYDQDIQLNVKSLPIQNNYPFPSAKTDIQRVTIASAEVLTGCDALKTALKLTLDISSTGWRYEPGDSFSIVCVNPDHEVDQLLNRLEVFEYADCLCEISVIEETKKRNAAIPAYLGENGTLRYWLRTTLDIRSVPKKAFLRALVEHTTDPGEKRRLQELCSKQGADHYARFLRQPNLGLIDVLLNFSSCKPPIALLLEHLPRLLPRSYSSTSCFEVKPGWLDFVFNIIEIPAGSGRVEAKQGICTGMLSSLCKPLLQSTCTNVSELTEHVKTLSLKEPIQIPVFLRGNQSFHPPADLSIPLIMIGPGTGVAPFIGFLQQRELSLQSVSDRGSVGETWLFFGCRHKDRDFIFRNELESFAEKKVLSHLEVCFSRESPEGCGPRYVQDNLLLHSTDVVTLILENSAEVFVCGDANNMAKDVKQAFVKAIETEKGLSAKEAEAAVFDMLMNRRYHEDVWS
ncbi:hypothetical protein LSH36_243g04004 [Paralvinella palmiformis]|uniref:Methionine synthase reductase n=1 Tax=Paralvinella palmiformis TaxID=53620 RepID=A0AAD9JLB3_9ANNE|nr:hypothetical protein LSH36_243g04004 [Paralvinella palmiformis]